MNYILRSVKVLGFTQKHRATKLRPTWQLTDVPRLKLLNALTALTSSSVSPRYVVYSQREFIWMKLAQGLNLNCRSVSEIEPESLLTPSPAIHTLPFLSSSSSLVGQGINDLICTCFGNRASFCCHVLISNNVKNLNNQIRSYFWSISYFWLTHIFQLKIQLYEIINLYSPCTPGIRRHLKPRLTCIHVTVCWMYRSQRAQKHVWSWCSGIT